MHRLQSPIRRGTAATEFAILLPLLVMLALASVDFGRFAYAHIALGNASRVGAEFGAVRKYDSSTSAGWEAQLEAAMHEEFAAVGGIEPANLDVEIEVVDDAYDLHRVTITSTYPFSTVVTWPGIPRPLEMQQTVAMRRFR